VSVRGTTKQEKEKRFKSCKETKERNWVVAYKAILRDVNELIISTTHMWNLHMMDYYYKTWEPQNRINSGQGREIKEGH